MNNKIFLIVLIIISFALISCEDVIDIKLDEGANQLAVDAFINDKPGAQIIKLRKTSGYFDNSTSLLATGASVVLKDNLNHTYNFLDLNNTGDYTWTPSANDTLVRLFAEYELIITYNGETFKANSVAFPAPAIDSLRFTYTPAQGPDGIDGYYGEFFSIDVPDMTNFYWIKAFKNGVFQADPGLINIAEDASFGGPGSDGALFIFPIRTNLTQFDKPFQIGDSVSVEIHAVNPETYFFLGEVRNQTTNGGLFATPPANVSTNIKNVNTASSVKAVGWFNIGMVSSNGKKVQL